MEGPYCLVELVELVEVVELVELVELLGSQSVLSKHLTPMPSVLIFFPVDVSQLLLGQQEWQHFRLAATEVVDDGVGCRLAQQINGNPRILKWRYCTI